MNCPEVSFDKKNGFWLYLKILEVIFRSFRTYYLQLLFDVDNAKMSSRKDVKTDGGYKSRER